MTFSTMMIDELQSSLLFHKQGMQGQKEEDQALKVTNTGRTRRRYDYKVEGRGRSHAGFKGGGRGRGRQPFNKALSSVINVTIWGIFNMNAQ